MIKNKQANDCKLGKVNGSRKCEVCGERKDCEYARKALERKALEGEGIMRYPSASYPIRGKDEVFVPKPIFGTSSFC